MLAIGFAGILVIAWLCVSVLGLVYPFRPFRTRRRAWRSVLLSLVGLVVLPVAAAIVGSENTGSGSPAEIGDTTETAGPASAGSDPVAARADGRPMPRVADAGTAARSQSCEAAGEIVGVKESTTLRTSPGVDAAAVGNAKATKALGSPQYHTIDGSTQVRRVCNDGEWTMVEISAPEWLAGIRGWVPQGALRTVETTTSGVPLLVEGDFFWDADTKPYKAAIVAVVNRIQQENRDCERADPGTVALSSDRSQPGDPVFFVACEKGEQYFNVWFRPSDAEASGGFAAVSPMDKGDATLLCEAAPRQAATHSSTVNFSTFMDVAYQTFPNGRTVLRSSFTAKNAFNLELKYQINCFFEGNTLRETEIFEAS